MVWTLYYMTDPPLTSVSQDIEKLAKCCVDTIIQIIEGKEYESHQVIDVGFVQGEKYMKKLAKNAQKNIFFIRVLTQINKVL